MENHRIKPLCETCHSNGDANSNQNEQCLTRFLKILNIEEYEFKGGSSARVCPPFAKDAAVQTDVDLLSIAPPRLIYIGNKVNTICKELSELMKSISKSTDCKKDQNPSNCDFGDAEEIVDIGTIDHIEEKIETSLKIVLELKNNFTALTARDSQSSSGTIPVNGVPTKVISRRETAKNKNLRLDPFDVNEVFPRISRTPQMPFNIFCDKDQRDLGRARAIVAPTRGRTNIINPIRRPECNFFCSTPKNSVPMRSQNSDLPKVTPKPQSSNPVPKGVSKRSASVPKKQQNQINPQKPPWR